jgi:Domain of unknown function (DUF4349)
MKRTDQPIDPEVLAQLDAIDATLAGEPVDPEYAEIAELALLLTADRPGMDDRFAASLDQSVARRFVPKNAQRARERRRWWREIAPIGGAVTAIVAAFVLVIVLPKSGGSSSSSSSVAASGAAPLASAASSGSAASGARGPAFGGSRRPKVLDSASARHALQGTLGPILQSSAVASPAAPRPPANGRRIVQSANLELFTALSRLDTVAQEVFDVVGRENGVVKSSTVASASQGYAQFRLSIPSNNLTDTMTALSELHYAHVSSRTDNTQDVNGQYISAGRRLADDRALRTSLLKQLTTAPTQTAIDSIKAQLHDAENAIARDEAAVRSLNNRINYSDVEVTIGTGVTPTPVHHSSKGFTLGKATHDAARVLTVAAGVALITLAALVPVLLVAALIWWGATMLRRRRREQALDTA